MRPTHVAIIGAGSAVAADHWNAYTALPDARVVAGVDLDPAARDRMRRAWDVPIYSSVRELATAGHRVDLAVICVPDRHHYEVAADCLDRWHTLVEKPLALNYIDARALYQRGHAHHRYLGVALQRAHMTPEIDAIAAQGAHGPLRHIDAWWLRSEPGPAWRLGLAATRGGVLADLGTHLLSQTDRLMTNTRPVRVTTNLWRAGRDRVDTHALVHIVHADGAVIRLTLGWGDPLTSGESTGMAIRWEHGAVKVRLLTTETPDNARAHAPLLRATGPHADPPAQLTPLRTVPECHAVQARRTIDAVRRGGPAPTTEVEASLRVMALLDAAYTSAEMGGAPVPVQH